MMFTDTNETLSKLNAVSGAKVECIAVFYKNQFYSTVADDAELELFISRKAREVKWQGIHFWSFSKLTVQAGTVVVATDPLYTKVFE